MARTLAELRRERGLSQRALAKALRLSSGAIANYEAGIRTPPLPVARRIAAFFGVPLDELRFAGESDSNARTGKAAGHPDDRSAREEAAA